MNPLPEKDTPASASTGEADLLFGPGIQPPVPKGSYELRILQSIRRIIRAVEIHSHRLVQEYEITGPQLGCLLALAKGGPATITQLARMVYQSPSTVVGIVDRLADKGLAVRERSSIDRRQVQVCVTEAGHALIANTPSPLQETLADALKNLPELEQVSITLALERVVEMMEARKIDAAPTLAIGPLTAQPGTTADPAGNS